MYEMILYVAAGTGFTFLMTALGSAIVLAFGVSLGKKCENVFNGFAAGVMIAASVWSLIIPASERVINDGKNPVFILTVGILSGVLFLIICDWIIDKYLSHKTYNNSNKGIIMTVLAVTLHNIPEGIAVAVAFVLAVLENNDVLMASAISLAIGIGIQNIPEGAAISIPLKTAGVGKFRAFIIGSMSGAVELIFGILSVFVFGFAVVILPFILTFAAGAMIYVVSKELIPNSNEDDSFIGALGVIVGFLVMMILDISLG